MNLDQETYNALAAIVEGNGWDAHRSLRKLLPTLTVTNTAPAPNEGAEGQTEANKRKPRSLSQNSAIHLYREHLAQALNDAGYGMKKVLKEEVDIDWNKDMVRRYIWLPIQKALFDKDTSADLTSDEVTKVWEHINRLISEKCGIHVPFPSDETKNNIRLVAHDNLARPDDEYPTYQGAPNF